MESPIKEFLPRNLSIKVQPFSREWIVSFKDPRLLWSDNWFALVFEVVSAVILFQAFRNAKSNGAKSAYIILAAISAAISVELLQIFPHSGYQLWWYHQGLVNILKQRVPSYVITNYAVVHFIAHNLSSKSNLPMLTRSVLTAICGTMIMLPCLWFAPRLLLLLLHFDDPVFKDQIVSIPYIQIVVMVLLFFHTSHLFEQNYAAIETQDMNTFNFVRCAIQSGLVAGIYTIVEQYLLFLLFNLILRTHTVVCLIAAMLILFYLARDEVKKMQMTSYSIQGITSPLLRKEFWFVAAALLFTSTLPLWLNTQNLKSSSDRLELGPCHVIQDVSNTSPLEVPRRRYVCPDDATRLNFDFHCVAKKELITGVKNKTKHYTVCGKSFEYPQGIVKYFTIYSLCCLAVFYTMMLFTFTFEVKTIEKEESKKID